MRNPLYDTLFAVHAGRGDPFLREPDGGVSGYDAFLAAGSRIANALADAGLRPGDRLAAQVAKSPQALALYAACVQAGIVFLPLNTAYTDSEIDYFLTDSGAAMLVCDSTRAPVLSQIATARGTATLTLDGDGGGSLADRARDRPPTFDTAARRPGDLAALLYTSGTTGRPKGAMLSHGNLLSNALVLADLWAFTPADVLIHALPIFHTHGLFVAINVSLAAGSSMIFLPAFDLDAILSAIPQATALMGVPTFYTRLLADDRMTRGLASGMRLFVSGSAPLPAQAHRRFQDRTGHRILERYGMTETGMIASNPYRGDRRAGTVGHALPGVEVIVTDPATGDPLPAGEVGGIEVRGPNVFRGYWNRPEKTAEDLRDSGFFVTGDLGTLDADGYLSIVGRDRDLIISGGLNVYPREVETLLDAQPGVAESAVIGVPHPDLGETVLALVVPACGARPDPDALADACRASLARYKHPRLILLVDALARNAMGKVEKRTLRAAYAETFS